MHMPRLSIHRTFCALAALASPACDAPDGVDADEQVPSYDVGERGALVQCDNGTFDLEQMNATLRAYPELGELLGLERVAGCEDAASYLAGLSAHIEGFPSQELAPPEAEFRVAHAEASNLTTNGVLRLTHVNCTGVLIHDRALITAAHCVAALAPETGTKNFWVENFEIDNFGGGSYVGPVRVNVHPDYAGLDSNYVGDDGDDIAVVKLTSGSFGFPAEDRHRIYTGAMSTIGTMRLYGQGVTSHTGGGGGVLRRMVYLPNWAGPEHFLMDAETSRVCKGDSGGPVMDVLPDEVTRVVAGLTTSIEIGDPADMCATTGGKQRAVRLQNKVRWIDDMIGGTDSDDCTPLVMDGWSYERCW
ncbi:Trypsin [Nannocystis exedens]|uniref:Trypsin n=2 Tax=Nannocystis exedens TaxID=54 RepID=A0A1I2I7R3_9BACT|nr:trypsin-like serine protease [Nannocystis exedens]PCC73550.1 Trypsin [Nannocystis exedens]SFF37668.1 Trypsin [Nannocystis exedens]